MNFNPFNNIERPKAEESPLAKKLREEFGINGDLYTDENAIELQKQFGTINISKLEEMERKGELTRIDTNQDTADEDYRQAA